jgi:uncharacterized protein (TIGR03083 family)
MESSRFLECLETDYLRMRMVVPGHLDDPVPTCPGWSVADLTRHVAQVHLHVVEMIQHGQLPEVWPPTGFAEADPLGLLDRGYRELTAEFARHNPGDACKTWYGPDQTVGFWIRRMAQETVIHRIDAEFGARALIAPVPDDLAVDGIDELLKVMLAYSFSQWPEDFTDALKDSPGRSYVIRADATGDSAVVSWLVRTAPGNLTVEGGPDVQAAAEQAAAAKSDVSVSGTPTAVLRWAWNRDLATSAPGESSSVVVAGDSGALDELRRCVVEATQ